MTPRYSQDVARNAWYMGLRNGMVYTCRMTHGKAELLAGHLTVYLFSNHERMVVHDIRACHDLWCNIPG
jgi:hypothetical protein